MNHASSRQFRKTEHPTPDSRRPLEMTDPAPVVDQESADMLRESDAELRLLIASIQDFAIYTLSPEGLIRSWNPGAERLHGYSPPEVVGQYFGVLYPKDGIDVGAADFQLRFAVDHGRHEQEGWQARKDGSRFWAHSLTTVLRDPQGQLHGFAKITQDFTQRKQAVDELRESHAFIQQIITSAQEGIVVYDRNLRYRVFNPYMENFTGLKERDVLGHQPLEFFPFLTMYGVDLVHQRALRGETLESEPIRFSLSHNLSENREGWSSGVWSPLRDSTGEIIGAVGFVRDITERVRSQERLQMLSRRLLTAQEQERRRLAIELHDEIGQVLTAVSTCPISSCSSMANRRRSCSWAVSNRRDNVCSRSCERTRSVMSRTKPTAPIISPVESRSGDQTPDDHPSRFSERLWLRRKRIGSLSNVSPRNAR